MPRLPHRLAVAASLAFLSFGGPVQAAPEVVASIAPLHGIAARIMQGGASAPRLLLPPGASPHGYALRPSDAAALADADVVFWIGPALETFLEKPLQALAAKAAVTPLMAAEGVRLLEYRDGDFAEDADHGHGHGHDHDHGHDHGRARGHDDVAKGDDHKGHDGHEGHGHEGHSHEGDDPHIWLDPANAAAMGRAMARALAAADPANADLYAANAEAFAGEADALARDVAARLAPVRDRPMVVFHDAYQYFERRFGLNVVGVINVSPERPPGARRLAEIRDRIRDAHVACVFVEPQFPPKLAETAAAGADTRIVDLDPLGDRIPLGARHYRDLIRQAAKAVESCGASG